MYWLEFLRAFLWRKLFWSFNIFLICLYFCCPASWGFTFHFSSIFDLIYVFGFLHFHFLRFMASRQLGDIDVARNGGSSVLICHIFATTGAQLPSYSISRTTATSLMRCVFRQCFLQLRYEKLSGSHWASPGYYFLHLCKVVVTFWRPRSNSFVELFYTERPSVRYCLKEVQHEWGLHSMLARLKDPSTSRKPKDLGKLIHFSCLLVPVFLLIICRSE